MTWLEEVLMLRECLRLSMTAELRAQVRRRYDILTEVRPYQLDTMRRFSHAHVNFIGEHWYGLTQAQYPIKIELIHAILAAQLEEA